MDEKQFDDVHITSAGGSHEWRYVSFDAPVLHVGMHGQQNLRVKDEIRKRLGNIKRRLPTIMNR